MAEIMGNITVLVFKDGTLSVASPFNPMSVLKILGLAATAVADKELKNQQLDQPPLVMPSGLPDKYTVQ